MIEKSDVKLDVPGDADFDHLAVLWESAVRATHRFLAEKDIDHLRPLVREQYLPSAQLLGARNANGEWLAFLGVEGDELEALFVRPDMHRHGIGRMLAEHAIREFGVVRVEVNEQNPGAVAFYERMGFVVEGRSEVDGQGRAFPILKMRLKNA